MLDRKALQALGCWTGYRLERVEWPQGDSRTLSLYLKLVSKVMYCEQCAARCQQIHETTVRRVRDLPLFEYRVVLHVPRRRVWCKRCGRPRQEKLDWLGRYQRAAVLARLRGMHRLRDAQWLRKTSVALALIAAWEIAARAIDNDLLLPLALL